MITYLLFGVTYALAAAIQPGPFQTFIISQTLKNGWKKTLPSAVAPILSDIPVIILVLLLLTNLPDWLLNVLQIGGGLLLLYLAYESFKSFLNFNKLNSIGTDKKDNTFWKAVLVNILNPNPYIGWSLIMGPLFLKGYHEATGNGIALIISFYVTIVICQAGIIVLFGLARNLGPKITHIILGIASAGLTGFGVFLLYHGLLSLR